MWSFFSLQHLLPSLFPLTPSLRCCVFTLACSSLVSYLASSHLISTLSASPSGVVYRDLKPENILVTDDGHAMVTDFDLSFLADATPKVRMKERTATCNLQLACCALLSVAGDPAECTIHKVADATASCSTQEMF